MEVMWQNVRCLDNGEAVSLNGTHLGHNIPDVRGNRYCINLVSVAGQPSAFQQVYLDLCLESAELKKTRIGVQTVSVFAEGANGLLLCLKDEAPPNSGLSLPATKAPADDQMVRMEQELKELRAKADDGYLSDGEVEDLTR
jgi:hypothetical protein